MKAQYLEAVFDSISDGILVVDSDFHITGSNKAAREFTGFSEKELLGRDVRTLFTGKWCGLNCFLLDTQKRCSPMKEIELDLIDRRNNRKTILVSTSLVHPPEDAGSPEHIVILMRDITQIRRLEAELEEQYHFQNIIGNSPRMQEVYEAIQQVAKTDTTVLIQGETGTGKELVAKAIHYESLRSRAPFVPIHCGAMPENLIESELFGHIKGAFTGAYRDKIGKFQLANSGTLFIDEVGDLSPTVQLKLLRFLQEKEFERVGDTRTIKADIRIISATNRDLKKLIQEGRFREDLYYRLKVVMIELPPLRERKSDIPLLVRSFIQKFNIRMGKNIIDITEEAMGYLMDYSWPGNVRELENSIEHAFIRCEGRHILPRHLPREIKVSKVIPPRIDRRNPQAPPPEEERYIIRNALKEAAGNKKRAAQILKISRTTLYKRLQELKIC